MLEYSNYLDTKETDSKDNQKEGSRLSPSAIEKLSYLYNEYRKDPEDESFLLDINYEKPKEIEEIEKNAKYAARGTLIHNLQYISLLFQRASLFNRLPTREDISSTFPCKDDLFYDSMLKIMEISIEDDISDNPLNNAQNFWNTWRFNGHQFTIENHKNNVINPSNMQKIWEEKAITDKDIAKFRANFTTTKESSINPEDIMLINEALTVMTLEFPNSRLVIPSYIDEIRIANNDNGKKKIKIIDYKTGKQFKNPGFIEKIQILLMISSFWSTMMSSTKKIRYSEMSTWDVVEHKYSNNEFPYFSSRALSEKTPFKGGNEKSTILDMMQTYCKDVSFSYINPLTQQEIEVDMQDAGFLDKNSLWGMLGYIEGLGEFYGKYKQKLKHYTNPKRSPFTLPVFPNESFLDDSKGKGNKGVQLAFNV